MVSGFINDGRRERLQTLGNTNIVTPDELQTIVEDGEVERLYR